MRQNVAEGNCLPYWCVSHNILAIGRLPLSDQFDSKEKWYAHLKDCAAGKECPFCQRLTSGPEWGGFDPLKELQATEQSLHPKAKGILGRWR